MPEPNASGLIPLSFDGAPVRVVVVNGEPHFVGRDVADRLGYADPTNAIKQHCKGVAKHHPLSTPGGVQNVRILAEPDVLRLIMGSKLPAAQRFEAWVFEEVLPAIRRTGSYSAPGATPAQPAIPTTEQKLAIVREARLTFGCPTAQRIWRELRVTEMPQPERPAQGDMFAQPAGDDALARVRARRKPPVITPEVLMRIEDRRDQGASRHEACAAEGVKFEAWKSALHRIRVRAQRQH